LKLKPNVIVPAQAVAASYADHSNVKHKLRNSYVHAQQGM